jgi:hypothetical protein
LKRSASAVYSIIANTRGPWTKAQTEEESKCSLQDHCKYQRTMDQGPDWRGVQVQFTASLQIPEDRGPRPRLKRRASAVDSISANTRGPWTKAQDEEENKCSLQDHCQYQRTMDQGPDWRGVQVQFTVSLQIPKDHRPRPRRKRRASAVYRIIANTRGPWTKTLTEKECKCSLQRHCKYQRTMDQGPGWRGEQVQFTALLPIPEDHGPRPRLKRIASAVYSILANTRGSLTKAQTEEESKCSLQHHCKYQRTMDQGRNWKGEQVQFTASLQLPEDHGPRPRLKRRASAVHSIISNTRGPWTKAQTEELYKMELACNQSQTECVDEYYFNLLGTNESTSYIYDVLDASLSIQMESYLVTKCPKYVLTVFANKYFNIIILFATLIIQIVLHYADFVKDAILLRQIYKLMLGNSARTFLEDISEFPVIVFLVMFTSMLTTEVLSIHTFIYNATFKRYGKTKKVLSMALFPLIPSIVFYQEWNKTKQNEQCQIKKNLYYITFFNWH